MRSELGSTLSAAPLPILFLDEDVVVVNKRSGLLVHRSDIDRGAQEFALQTVRDQLGRRVYPVHRLDRPTSGALIFGLSPDSARAIAEQFATGQVEKVYVAVVRGVFTGEVTVDHPLTEELDAKSDRHAKAGKPPQTAVTVISNLANCEFQQCVDKFPTAQYSLVRAQPLTGRKHQIRRHLRHLGHPIIGDVQHGSGKHNRFFRDSLKVGRLLLACTAISFHHPRHGHKIQVKAPLAPEFSSLVDKLNWRGALESH